MEIPITQEILQLRIMICDGNFHIWYQKILVDSFWFNGSQYEPNLPKILAIQNSQVRKKSYYKKYDFKIVRAFHNQEIKKQKIYEKKFTREDVMDYNPRMCFEIGLINLDKSKTLTKSN